MRDGRFLRHKPRRGAARRAWRGALVGLSVWLSAGGPAAAAPVLLTAPRSYIPYAGEEMSGGGLITEIVRRAYATQDIPVRIAFLARETAYRETRKGAHHGTYPFRSNDLRATDFYVSDPVLTTRHMAMTRRRSDLRAQSLAGLIGTTYCRPTGMEVATALKQMGARGEVSRTAPLSLRACVRMLGNGLADFVAVRQLRGLALAEQHFGTARRVRFLQAVLRTTDYRVLFSRKLEGAERARDDLNAGLAALRRRDAINALLRQYRNRLRNES